MHEKLQHRLIRAPRGTRCCACTRGWHAYVLHRSMQLLCSVQVDVEHLALLVLHMLLAVAADQPRHSSRLYELQAASQAAHASTDFSGSGGGGGSGRQEVHEVQVGRSTHRPPPDLRARSLPPELRTAWQRRLEKWREQRRRKHQETEEECARSAKKVCHDLASAC